MVSSPAVDDDYEFESGTTMFEWLVWTAITGRQLGEFRHLAIKRCVGMSHLVSYFANASIKMRKRNEAEGMRTRESVSLIRSELSDSIDIAIEQIKRDFPETTPNWDGE